MDTVRKAFVIGLMIVFFLLSGCGQSDTNSETKSQTQDDSTLSKRLKRKMKFRYKNKEECIDGADGVVEGKHTKSGVTFEHTAEDCRKLSDFESSK